MRHSTEDEKQAYEQMLERMSVPLYGPKVYMVHRESGQYPDWEYDVKDIFSTYEKARAYVESQLTVKCYHYAEEWHLLRDVPRSLPRPVRRVSSRRTGSMPSTVSRSPSRST